VVCVCVCIDVKAMSPKGRYHSVTARSSAAAVDDDGLALTSWGWLTIGFWALVILATLGVSAAVLGIVNENKNSWKGHQVNVKAVEAEVGELNEKLHWVKKELDELDDIKEGIYWIKKDLREHEEKKRKKPRKPFKRDSKEWPTWGKNLENSKIVKDRDVSELFDEAALRKGESEFEKQWGYKYEGMVGASATVTTTKDIVYSTAFSGQVVAVDRQSGQQLWVRYGNEILGLPPFNASDPCSPLILSRNAPAVFKNKYGREGIIFSLPDSRQGSPCQGNRLPKYTGPVYAVALDRFTGETMFRTVVHEHPWSVGTSSGSVLQYHKVKSKYREKRNYFFAGISSLENSFNLLEGYPCCSFRGRMYNVDLDNGALVWGTYTLPDIEGYGGAGVTGSSPAIWPEANLVFFGSGNGYSAPDDIDECRLVNNYPDKAALQCLEDGVYIDSTLALDIDSGEVVWAFRAQGVDLWTVPCILGPNPFCPNPPGPDYDLLQSPILIQPKDGQSSWVSREWEKDEWYERESSEEEDWESTDDDDKDWKEPWRDERMRERFQDWTVVAHYKSGIMWSFRAIDGKLRCSRATGTAGTLGGGQWGSAADAKDTRLYVVQDTGAPGDPDDDTYLLPNGKKACDGSFWAIDVDTCEVSWVAQVTYSRPPEECGELNPLGPFDMFTYPPTTGLPTNKTVDGKPQKPISETGTTPKTCPVRSGTPTHLETSEFANAHGSVAIARGVVYGSTMTGNGYGLRLTDGKCLTQFHCPFGGIYGGVSMSWDQLFINCGYGRLLPAWLPQPGCSLAQPELCGAGCPEGECELMALQIVKAH